MASGDPTTAEPPAESDAPSGDGEDAPLDYQKKSNRDLYEADYLMLGGLETVNENIKNMRAKVNKYLDPKRYADDDDTPRMGDDDETKDVRKQLAKTQAQIGMLQRQELINAEILKKQKAATATVEQALKEHKIHHFKVGIDFGEWLRQGRDLANVFTGWRHHVQHLKALEEAEGLRKTVGGLQEQQIARMRKYLELWQGNVERTLFQDIFSSWKRATADSDLYRQIAAAEGAAEAARRSIGPLEEKIRGLEEDLARKDAEMAAALARAAEEIERMKQQQTTWHEEIESIVQSRVQTAKSETRHKEEVEQRVFVETEVQCNEEEWEDVPEELRVASRQGRPMSKNDMLKRYTEQIAALEDQVRELREALAESEARAAAEARRREEEVSTLRAAFAREAEELRAQLKAQLEAELAKMQSQRQELVKRASVVRTETVTDTAEIEAMRKKAEALSRDLERARQEAKLTVAVYVKAEQDWKEQLDQKAKFIEMLRARGTELQRIIDTYEEITDKDGQPAFLVPASEAPPYFGPKPVEPRPLKSGAAAVERPRPVRDGWDVIDVRRAVADLPFGTDPDSDDLDADRKFASFGLGARTASEPLFHPAPARSTSGKPSRFTVRRPAHDTRRARPLFDIPEERPSSIANSSGGFKRPFL